MSLFSRSYKNIRKASDVENIFILKKDEKMTNFEAYVLNSIDPILVHRGQAVLFSLSRHSQQITNRQRTCYFASLPHLHAPI
jgi:hypothetical protein